MVETVKNYRPKCVDTSPKWFSMASYLTDDDFLGKKGKVTKESVTKREFKFQD